MNGRWMVRLRLLKINKISVDFFYQYRKLDTEIGEYGLHNQSNTWK